MQFHKGGFHRGGWVAVLLAIFLALAAMPSQAAGLEEALTHFATDDYGEIQEGITAVAQSGDPRAAFILEALQDDRLLYSAEQKKVFYKDVSGKLLDAATAAPVAGNGPADIETVGINNRLRRAIDAALGGLTLMSPNPARRYDAAQAVFKSHEANVLPAIEAAIEKEQDARIGRALAEARAAIILNADDASEADKLAAVAVIRARGDQDSVALLQGLPAETPAAVVEAAKRAVASMVGALAVWEMAQNAWYGLSLGSVLLLAAIGLAITFGVMGVINMAHGEMVMIGAYATFVVQQALRAWAPGLMDASLVLAIPAAFLAAGAVGVALERGVIRFLYGRPLETLLMTWGVSMILQQAVRSIFGPTNREVTPPSWMTGSVELASGLALTTNRIWIIGFGLAVLLAMVAVTRFTWFGLQMRAVTQNRGMARAMGVRSGRVDALTFGLGSGIAGVAGVALSQLDNVSPNLGQGYIVDSFMVVVFGGVGNLLGTLIGAMTLGVVNKFLEPLAGAVLGKILVLMAIILFIQARPRGLFALRGRAAES